MKKFLLCMALLLCLTVSASAAETVTLEDAGITLTLPDGYHAIYVGMGEDAPQLRKLGISYETAMDLLYGSGDQLIAMDESRTRGIEVSVAEATMADFCYTSDVLMQLDLLSWSEGCLDEHGNPVEAVLYPHADTVFYRTQHCFVSSDDVAYYNDIFYTVYGGKDITIYFKQENKPIAQHELEKTAAMVDGMSFLMEPMKPRPEKQTAGYRYIQKETGAQFDVPDDWITESYIDDLGMESLEMMSNDGTVSFVYYVVDDLYEKLSSEAKALCKRAEFNMDLMSAEYALELAQEWGVAFSAEDIQYNGYPFVRMEMQCEYEWNDTMFETPAILSLHVENGYGHVFLFYGDTDSYHYSTHLEMLDSFEVPIVTVEEEKLKPADPLIGAESEEEQKSPDKSVFSKAYIRSVVKAIYVMIAGAIAWIVRKIRKKKGHPDHTPKPEEIRMGYVCSNCGKEVKAGQSFCDNCGQELKHMDET